MRKYFVNAHSLTLTAIVSAALVVSLSGCRSKPAPPLTPLESERKQMQEELASWRAKAYIATSKSASNIADHLARQQQLSAAEARFLLTVSYAASGYDRLALYESMQIRGADLPPNLQAFFMVTRGYVYASLNWPHLSEDQLMRLAPAADASTEEARALNRNLQIGMFLNHAAQGDWEKANKQIQSAREFFEKDPLGEVCIIIASARGGNLKETSDAVDRLIESGGWSADQKEQLAEIAASLRNASAIKTVLQPFLQQRLVGALSGVRDYATKYSGAMDQLRQASAQLVALWTAQVDRGAPDKNEEAETQPPVRPQNWAQPLEKTGVPNFYRVSDDCFRGAQPTKDGFRRLKEMGVKTIINLRSFHSDRDLIKDSGLQYEHLWMKPWHPEDKEIVAFLKTVTDPQRVPVFFHCQRGADRTGTMCAIYRIAVQGWTKDEAIAEMTGGGFGFHPAWENLIRYLRDLDIEKVKEQAGISAPAQAP